MARLNIQGLARRDEGLMRCLVPDIGHTLVSCDLSSGEPTVTTHFSGDINYYDATFGMVGKAPYYAGSLLKIDDIYLTSASFSPMGRDAMRDAFNSRYGTLTFAEKWLEDPEYLKDNLKSIRKPAKPLVLGLGYCMGPRKLVKTAYENGDVISKKQATEFYNNYWSTFGGVKAFADKLSKYYERTGYIINPFSYRLKPDKSYKALNYYIQSSVSGIMHILGAKYRALVPYAKYITTIHDELIYSIPNENLAESKQAMQVAARSLNDDLKWTVNIRVGWKEGRDMYEAK